MKESEFQSQYQRLADVFPQKYGNHEKMKTIWDQVQEFDAVWFERLCDRIVMSPYGDINLGEIVAGERRAIKSKQFSEDVIAAMDKVNGRITDAGFDKVLKRYDVKNIWEAVKKSKEGKL